MKLFYEVERLCEICLKYKQPSLTQIVGFSLSKEFNDVVLADLKKGLHFYILLTIKLVLV